MWIRERHGFTLEQHALEVLDRQAVPAAHAVGTVKRHQASPGVDGEKQRADVAEADDDFRIPPYGVEVEIRQHAAAAPASTNGQHRADARIGKEHVDIGRAIPVLACQVTVAVEQMAADFHQEAERFERLFRDLQLDRLKGCIGRRDEAHHIAGDQTLRLDECLTLQRQGWETPGCGGGRHGFQERAAMHPRILR